MFQIVVGLAPDSKVVSYKSERYCNFDPTLLFCTDNVRSLKIVYYCSEFHFDQITERERPTWRLSTEAEAETCYYCCCKNSILWF